MLASSEIILENSLHPRSACQQISPVGSVNRWNLTITRKEWIQFRSLCPKACLGIWIYLSLKKWDKYKNQSRTDAALTQNVLFWRQFLLEGILVDSLLTWNIGHRIHRYGNFDENSIESYLLRTHLYTLFVMSSVWLELRLCGYKC